MEQHKLIEIPQNEWPELRDLFLVNWPEHILGYSIVDNYLEMCRKGGPRGFRNLVFLSLDGDWRRDGTFLVIDRYQLLLYSLNSDEDHQESKSRLEIALGLVDWTNGYKVSSFSSKHRPSVLRVIESRGLELEFNSETFFFYLSKEEANQLPMKVPEDFILKRLDESHLEMVNDLWPYRHSGSLFFIRRIHKFSTHIAAFKKLATGEEVPIGWCFTYNSGALGLLQVREEFQGQGVGKLLTVAMAKLRAKEQKDSFAFVNVENESSQKLFEKLNFRIVGKIYWLRTFPVGKRESVWNGDFEGDQ